MSDTVFTIPRRSVKIITYILLVILFCLSVGSGVVALHNYKKKDLNDDYTYSSKNLLNAQLYTSVIFIPIICIILYFI